MKFIWRFYWILKRKVYLVKWLIYPNTMAWGPMQLHRFKPALYGKVWKISGIVWKILPAMEDFHSIVYPGRQNLCDLVFESSRFHKDLHSKRMHYDFAILCSVCSGKHKPRAMQNSEQKLTSRLGGRLRIFNETAFNSFIAIERTMLSRNRWSVANHDQKRICKLPYFVDFYLIKYSTDSAWKPRQYLNLLSCHRMWI